MRRTALLFLALAILYVGPGLLPGHTFAPLDIPLDFDAWKEDPTQRVSVSNSLLTDVVVQFVAWDHEVVQLLRRGELPWTNRWAGDGGPLFANPQTALFSPFTWPRLLFGLKGWALTALMKLLCAAFCAYWFARELDVAHPQAVLSGVTYAAAGYMIVWLLYPITNVFSLLPGLAAAAWRLSKYPSIRNAALVILFAALCTAGGHPETLFIGVIGIAFFLVWEAEKRPDLGLSALIPSVVGAALGFMLLALQIAPFLHLLARTHAKLLRPTIPHSFRLWAAISQGFPGILGSPVGGELDFTALPMAENFNLRAGGYVGALVLVAIAFAWRELAPSLRRGVIVGAVALVLSWYPPGVWSVLKYVPVVQDLILEYAASLFVLFGAIAAGPAIAILARRQRKRLGAAFAIVGLAGIVGGVIPAVPAARATLTSVARSGIEQLRARGHLRQAAEVYEQRLDRYLSGAARTTLRRVVLPALCWLGAGVAVALPLRRRALLLSIAAAGELVVFGVGFNPGVKMSAIAPEPSVVGAIRQLDPQRRFLLAEHFEVFPANLATLYGVRDAISYDALNTVGRVNQLQLAGYDAVMHTFNPILRPEEVRTLGGLGVRFVLSRGDVAGATRIAGPPAPAVGVYEIAGAIPTAMPRNEAPAGFLAGLVISILALLASVAWLRLYLLPIPEGERPVFEDALP